jgi:DNA repair protein RecO (recombination protein O)
VHLLALGGYGLPLAHCARSGEPLEPPLGTWNWRCSLIPSEGFVVGAIPGAQLVLNASELALLQRLPRPALPRRRDGVLMGPEPVWLRLLALMELWSREHLGRNLRSWSLLRQCFNANTPLGADVAASSEVRHRGTP